MVFRKFKTDLQHQDFQMAVENTEDLVKNQWHVSMSQSGQDLFVVAMMQGVKQKSFLEIGCSQPKYSNNTYILEKIFQYSGVSIDIEYDTDWPQNSNLPMIERSWSLCRPNTIWHKTDALTFDYSSLPNYFDYLQVDIDPAVASYTVLEKICKNKQFAVITFEHDDWQSAEFQIKDKSRNYLSSLGYELVVSDVGVHNKNDLVSFEDWWAHPDHVEKNIIDSYKWIESTRVKEWQEILFNYEISET
jgi:hypothetical protein